MQAFPGKKCGGDFHCFDMFWPRLNRCSHSLQKIYQNSLTVIKKVNLGDSRQKSIFRMLNYLKGCHSLDKVIKNIEYTNNRKNIF